MFSLAWVDELGEGRNQVLDRVVGYHRRIGKWRAPVLRISGKVRFVELVQQRKVLMNPGVGRQADRQTIPTDQIMIARLFACQASILN